MKKTFALLMVLLVFAFWFTSSWNTGGYGGYNYYRPYYGGYGAVSYPTYWGSGHYMPMGGYYGGGYGGYYGGRGWW